MRQEFSIARWIWGAGISIVLAGVIGWFNVRQFEMIDALPYLIVLGFITSISIWLNRYCASKDETFRTAAFASKVFLLLIMAINAAYSFAAMRELSIAKKLDALQIENQRVHDKEQTQREQSREKAETDREQERTKQIESITQGAGPKARYEIAKKLELGKVTTIENGPVRVDATITNVPTFEQSAFKKYESPLFWIMVMEACAAGLCFILMSGLKSLRTGEAKTPSIPFFGDDYEE